MIEHYLTMTYQFLLIYKMVLNLYVVKNILVVKYLNKGKSVACKNNEIKSRIVYAYAVGFLF